MNITHFTAGEKVSENRINEMIDAVNENGKITIVDKTSDTGTTFAIDPNKLYRFGTKTSLTITLNAGEGGMFSHNSNYPSIGARNSSGSFNGTGHFMGKIHGIRLYNKNLTSEEILFNQTIDIEKYNITI